MKIEDVTDYIAGQVRYHEEELARFRAALDVILEVAKTGGVTKPAPMFTVVKTKTVSKPKTTKRGAVRNEIVKMASKQDTVTTKDITKDIYGDAPTMPQQKSVWNALTAMTKNGDLVRIGVGIYSKPKPVIQPVKELETA